MDITATTITEALAIAAELRAMHVGTDWVVRIHRPLFPGDAYHVVVEG